MPIKVSNPNVAGNYFSTETRRGVFFLRFLTYLLLSSIITRLLRECKNRNTQKVANLLILIRLILTNFKDMLKLVPALLCSSAKILKARIDSSMFLKFFGLDQRMWWKSLLPT
uniref:Uncharacterized protein n=1 Tax=Candidatus Kentrum sp. MB TaxID=2138164 RepID=A0A450XPI5_9GAMM|nr:MAG: hypothetical protein BECKMB1821G_GA0114241_102615 [Candidatus Kentron sp. MB]VFK31048.1 MAG: hypothetical protein BECKMB1821I_GA0114274_102016 [Candidatus Kentron sp. MB]VFK75498.1 MAG: hypothetical protein BECKMB1821H_GA0114242_102415 [Candidatus Kentron sp. MB]